MDEVGSLVLLAVALPQFTTLLGAVFQALPLPLHFRRYGPMLEWDGIIGLFAISFLSGVQIIVNWLSLVLNDSFGGPFSSSTTSFALITSQLTLIDSSLVLLIAGISSTVVLAPVAEILARMFGPAVTAVTSAIILWVALEIVIGLFPRLWLWIFVIGLCFFSLPFRLGRRLGSYLMSTSVLTSIALPILPSSALALEGVIGYQTFLQNFVDIGSRIQSDPLSILSVLSYLPSAVAGLMAAVIVALILFPLVYLFMISVLTRSLAELIGGSSTGPTLSGILLPPSRGLAREVAE